MVCPWCSFENVASARYCGDCGRSLQFDSICGSCGSPNPAQHTFCDACGESLHVTSQPDGVSRPPAEDAGVSEEPLAVEAGAATDVPPLPEEAGVVQTADALEAAEDPEIVGTQPEPDTPKTAEAGEESMPEDDAPRQPQRAQDKVPVTWTARRQRLVSGLKRHKWEVFLVAALTGIGAFLRIVLLTELPPGLHGDEAWTGLEAQRILRDGPIGPWSPSALGQPAGTFYWTALIFRLFEPGLFTLRFSMALLGALTVPAFYLFARELLGWRAAAIGAFLLAISFWHIHYSRIAFTLIALPLVTSVALYFLVRGLKDGRIVFVALAGGISALGVYVYGGFVSLALSLLVFWAFMALRRELSYPKLRNLALAFLVPAVVVALPFLHKLYWSPSDVLSYGAVSSTFKDRAFQEAEDLGGKARFVVGRLARGFTVYATGGQLDFTDGMGSRGLLGPLAFGLFVVGTAVALRRWREWRRALLLAGLLGGVLVTAYLALPSWAESRRGIGALPIVFALAGLGGDTLVTLARRWMPQRLAYAALGLVLLLAAFLSVNYYFGTLVRATETRWVFVEELTKASEYVNSLPPEDLYVYFYSGRWSYNYETRRFLVPDVPGEDRSREFGNFVLQREPTHSRVVYLLLPPYGDVSDELRAMHTEGTYHEVKDGERFIFGAFHPDGGG